jgi:hypothetical protein
MKSAEIKPVYDAFIKQSEPKFLDFFIARIHELNNFVSAYENHLLKYHLLKQAMSLLLSWLRKTKPSRRRFRKCLA